MFAGYKYFCDAHFVVGSQSLKREPFNMSTVLLAFGPWSTVKFSFGPTKDNVWKPLCLDTAGRDCALALYRTFSKVQCIE